MIRNDVSTAMGLALMYLCACSGDGVEASAGSDSSTSAQASSESGDPGDDLTVGATQGPGSTPQDDPTDTDAPSTDEGSGSSSSASSSDGEPYAFCGDGIVQHGEDCDRTVGEVTCADVGWLHGTLLCNDNCQFDDTYCSSCGDGQADTHEACDGDDLRGESCASLGFNLGPLSCDASCEIDATHCSTCGDGAVNGDETCDGGDFAGDCECDASCQLHGTECAPPSLVITEFFPSPLENPDAADGQWFELYNPTKGDRVLTGCVVSGDVASDTFVIDTYVVIPEGGYATIGTGSAHELGFVPDFVMPSTVDLRADTDTISIACGSRVLDTVEYRSDGKWPPAVPGAARATRKLGADGNDDGWAWCIASNVYGLGQTGTPGAPNDCP